MVPKGKLSLELALEVPNFHREGRLAKHGEFKRNYELVELILAD